MRKVLLIGTGATVVGLLLISHGVYVFAHHIGCRARGKCECLDFIWNGLILGKPVDWSGTEYE